MQTLKKWGNSLALRIPGHLAKELNVAENSMVECQVSDGVLLVRPVDNPKYTLHELLAGITPENVHAETETGAPVGGEIW